MLMYINRKNAQDVFLYIKEAPLKGDRLDVDVGEDFRKLAIVYCCLLSTCKVKSLTPCQTM